MPIEQHMRCDVTVSERVACWQELSAFSEIDTVVREWLVAGSAIEYLTAYDVFRLT